MSTYIPQILVFGHSFVRRLREALLSQFDSRASANFHLPQSGHVELRGTGGRTVDKVLIYDLHVFEQSKADIVVLDIGTNDLGTLAPEVVGSKIDDLVCLLRTRYGIRIVVVCQVLDRNIAHTDKPDRVFNAKAAVLRQYLSVVLAGQPGVLLWEHRDFAHPARSLLAKDGVHCNAGGQYCLYRSYRGAILQALKHL